MSGLYVYSFHLLLEVPTVLWSVVCLYHGNGEAPLLLCFQHSLCCEPLSELWRKRDMCHPSKEVNDRVVVQPSATLWIHMVNGICLDKLARLGDVRPPGVVPTDSWLPRAVKAVVAAENPPHTADDTWRCSAVVT